MTNSTGTRGSRVSPFDDHFLEDSYNQSVSEVKEAIMTKANDWYDKIKNKWSKEV